MWVQVTGSGSGKWLVGGPCGQDPPWWEWGAQRPAELVLSGTTCHGSGRSRGTQEAMRLLSVRDTIACKLLILVQFKDFTFLPKFHKGSTPLQGRAGWL